MSRTIWLALFCMVGLGPAIAIKVAAPPAFLVAEPAHDQSRIEPAFAPNELAKADRLELHDTPAKAEAVVPATKTMPAESSSTGPETIKKTPSGHWQDANATIGPVASPRRRTQHTKSNASKKNAGQYPPNEAAEYSPNKRAEVWHCRQDAVGGILRSLDLSPRCNM
jgi:hypothetical protein